MNIDPNSPLGRDILKAVAEGRATSTSVNHGLLSGASLSNLDSESGLSEADFQQRVIALAHANRWTVAHFRRVRVQRANGETYWETPVAADGRGFPDLLLVRDRTIFRELKTDKGTLLTDQIFWRDVLLGAGADWKLWRPRDWDSIVEELK